MAKKVKVNLTIDKEVVEKAKELGINMSQFCENMLKKAIKQLSTLESETNPNAGSKGVVKNRRFLNVGPGSGFEPEHRAPQAIRTSSGFLSSPATIDFQAVRDDFEVWLRNRVTRDYANRLIRYCERYDCRVSEPMDVVRLFHGVSVGQRHNLIRAFRNLLNFYEAQGLAHRDWLNVLRMNIPKDETGEDLYFPEESEIIVSLRLVKEAETRLQSSCAVYNLVLDSLLRATEAVRLFNNIVLGRVKVECHDGFYIAPLGYFRGTKRAYFGFFTQCTMKLIEACSRPVAHGTFKTFRRRIPGKVVAPKYLRKFGNDVMTDETLNIPESVADFIQGRTPKTVGAKHYMRLKRKAMQYYPRYASYLEVLRRKAYS